MNRRKYWKFAGVSSAQLLAGSMILPVLAPYLSSLGYSDSWISTVFGIFPFVMLISAIFVGELSDEVGRSWTIRLAVIATMISYSLYWLGASWSIVVARVLDAVSYATLLVLVLAKIEDLLDEGSRGRYTGVYLSLKDGVRLLGPLAGGYLADRWIGAPFITALVLLAGIVFLLRDAKPHTKRAVEVHPVRNLKRFVADVRLRPFLILGPVLNAMIPATAVFLPLLITKNLGLGYFAVGVVASAEKSGRVLQFFFGDLSDAIGNTPLLVAGPLLTSAALLAVSFVTHSYYAIIALMVLHGIGLSVWSVSYNSYLSRIGESSGREGTILGTYMSIGKVGETIAYLAAGSLAFMYGYAAVFFVLGGLGLVAGVGSSALFLRLRNHQASVD